MIDRFQLPEIMKTNLTGIPTSVHNEVRNVYHCSKEGQILK